MEMLSDYLLLLLSLSIARVITYPTFGRIVVYFMLSIPHSGLM